MDYNDNDYESQNLHLGGEESSKLPSSLRPFVLPKFDFDDNLHGNLRFDSLVDNEVFLGIPSQDDNQWIEDFSRGSNGIRFCSTSTVSCALSRCNNVWSEATSSESVEMLLKSVGQEEMVQGESMVKESDMHDQLDSTMQAGTNLVSGDKTDDVESIKADQNVSVPDRSAVGEAVCHDHSSDTAVRNISSSGVCIDDKDNSLVTPCTNLDNENKETSHELVSNSSTKQVQKSFPVSDPGSENLESTHEEHVGMLGEQDKISDISHTRSSFTEFDKLNMDVNTNDEILNDITVQTDSVLRCSVEFTPVTESLSEERIVAVQVNTIGGSMPEMGESVSSIEDHGNVDIAPAVRSGCGSAVVDSTLGIKQLSEGHIMSFDMPSVSSQGDTPEISIDVELNQDSVAQLSNQPEGVAVEDLHPSNPPAQDSKSDINHAGHPGNSQDSSAGPHGPQNSGIAGVSEVMQAATVHKESLMDEDGSSPPLLDGDAQTRGLEVDDNLSMQVDFQGGDLDVSQTHREDSLSMQVDDNLSTPAGGQGGDFDVIACEKDGQKALDDCNVTCDAIGKAVGFGLPGKEGEVNVEIADGSQSNASAGDDSALNGKVGDENVKSFCHEDKQLTDNHEQNVLTLDVDQNKELEPTKQQTTPSSMESLVVVTEGATASEFQRNTMLDSATAGESETDKTSVSFVEESYSTVPEEVTEELFEKVEHFTSDLAEQISVSVAEKSLGTKTGRVRVTNSSTVSESGSVAEIEESDQHGASPTNCSGPPQVEINKKESLESNTIKVSDGLPTSTDTLSKQDDTFTFDIRPLEGKSTEVSAKAFQDIPATQAVLPLSGEGLPSVSGRSQKDMSIIKEVSQSTSVLPSGGPSPSEGLKDSSARKPRRRNSKSGKESAKKGNLAKDTTLPQKTERFDKSATFLSPLAAGQLMSFDSAVKPTVGVSVSAPNLPDLNTAGPSSVAFHQPFTDLQQVQLRAQIFVYGSLIQGGAPDEACMISAFGVSDGGRSAWEPSWRACVERRHGKKYQENKSETPLQSRTGVPKAADQTSMLGFSPSEVISTPIGRASDKAAPSPLVNPIIPLSSPLWNISTPSCGGLPSSSMTRFEYPSGSPLLPYQTPPARSFTAHTTTWPSQPPFPVPWLASSKVPSFDIRTNYSASLITEPVKLTPVTETSLQIAPQEKHLPIPAINTGATTVFAGTPTYMDLKKVSGSSSQTSAVTKTRKRKKSSGADAVQIPVTAPLVDTVSTPLDANHVHQKVPAVEGFNQNSLVARNQADTVSTTTIVSSHYLTPVSVPAATFMPNQIFSTILPSISSDKQRGRVDKRALDMESFSKVEEAKIQAEQAAALADEAVSHCQGVWKKLDQQKDSGLTTDAEAKLASAAVVIAASASVAKAAAAAAKIASTAAMQAKQMAEEAVATHRSVNTPGYNICYVSSSGNTTPVSTFWGGDSNNASTLAISAAREAAKKRVEAASTASRHAESLDAILRAAELAAEAVSHTGKIVGIDDPFSLNQLVKAGPDDYWKVSNMSTEPVKNTRGNTEDIPSVSKNVNEGPDKDVHDTNKIGPPVQTDISSHTRNDNTNAEENLISSFKHSGRSSKSKKGVLDTADVISTVSESDTELRSSSFIPSNESNNASIKEGSAVEVLKEFDNKRAWFSAKVLSLKDDKALVCYTELQADEDSEQLKEWVSLEAQGGKAPTVRISHPMTAMQFEGTRKRRRAAIKDYDWSVGDRVDAWVKDCWREGIITDMNKKDPTSLTVHFPVEEETIIVKVWHLRPTLLWSDGQWSEYCRAGDHGTSQGDTPVEKRAKFGSRGLESRGKGKIDEKIGFADGGGIEEPNLPLSASENVFDIGITKDESQVRTMRSGLQKEGPRTVFGLPKPGKKRKFMDVSKHYVSEKTKKTTATTTKNPAPLAFGSRGSRNISRVDAKEKQIPESKPRPLRSGKPPGVPTRTLPRKGDSAPSRPSSSDAASTDQFVRGSSSNDDNESGEQIINEIGSFSHVEDNSRGTFVFSSQAVPTESRKKAPVRPAKSDRVNKGKLPPSAKLAKTGTHEKSTSEASEPRRSNRRIQPTSRLLEGLQSSLIIPKFPSSHEKGQRSHRGTPRGNDNRG